MRTKKKSRVFDESVRCAGWNARITIVGFTSGFFVFFFSLIFFWEAKGGGKVSVFGNLLASSGTFAFCSVCVSLYLDWCCCFGPKLNVFFFYR